MSRVEPWFRKSHGTEARARRHYREGTKPCLACRIAQQQARSLRRAAAAAAVLVIVACSSSTSPGPVTLTTVPVPSDSAAAIRKVHDPGHVTGTLTGPCHFRAGGTLPDPRCTPGAYDPAMTKAVICAPGFRTTAYRPPKTETAKFKYNEAYPAYGLPRTATSELDHLIPLELGGANDAANLWPEVGKPSGNPKDAVENKLKTEVCSGQVSLAVARQAIVTNWTTAVKAGT